MAHRRTSVGLKRTTKPPWPHPRQERHVAQAHIRAASKHTPQCSVLRRAQLAQHASRKMLCPSYSPVAIRVRYQLPKLRNTELARAVRLVRERPLVARGRRVQTTVLVARLDVLAALERVADADHGLRREVLLWLVGCVAAKRT